MATTKKKIEPVAPAANKQEALAKALDCPKKTVDFTPPAARQEVHSFGEEDLVVVGSPTSFNAFS